MSPTCEYWITMNLILFMEAKQGDGIMIGGGSWIDVLICCITKWKATQVVFSLFSASCFKCPSSWPSHWVRIWHLTQAIISFIHFRINNDLSTHCIPKKPCNVGYKYLLEEWMHQALWYPPTRNSEGEKKTKTHITYVPLKLLSRSLYGNPDHEFVITHNMLITWYPLSRIIPWKRKCELN
jgi:hypothetical protein